jgi:4-hydroxybenzoate polyprenyltransferase
VLAALSTLTGLVLTALMLLTGLALAALLLLAGFVLAALLRILLLLLLARILLFVRHWDVLHRLSEAPRPTKDNPQLTSQFLVALLRFSVTN